MRSGGTAFSQVPEDRWKHARFVDAQGTRDPDSAYTDRGAFITLLSVINAFWRSREERLYGKAIKGTRISEPPLFILGHWRSGDSLPPPRKSEPND